MIEIKVPEMGESITDATIAQWLKKEGDPVSPGDMVVELETDKVNLEINVEDSGVIHKTLKQPGFTYKSVMS